MANKYLIDQEASYGIYLVGWYGVKSIGEVEKLKKECEIKKPKTAQELEKCLQHLCNEVVHSRTDIDGIKAIVVDVSL